jgi:hypothetical protein
MVRHIDAFSRVREQLREDGDFWVLAEYIQKQGVLYDGR